MSENTELTEQEQLEHRRIVKAAAAVDAALVMERTLPSDAVAGAVLVACSIAKQHTTREGWLELCELAWGTLKGADLTGLQRARAGMGKPVGRA